MMKKRPTEPDRCHQWPKCVCNRLWLHWQQAVGELGTEPEEIEAAQAMLNAMLACVSCRCPDWRFRRAASLQLMHPIWSADLLASEGH
jgi:hypothetical protein